MEIAWFWNIYTSEDSSSAWKVELWCSMQTINWPRARIDVEILGLLVEIVHYEDIAVSPAEDHLDLTFENDTLSIDYG